MGIKSLTKLIKVNSPDSIETSQLYKLSGKNNNKLNISFVTQKKIGNAVKRNKIKRRLRNIMIEALKKMDLNLSYSYLLICKKNIFDDEFQSIKKTIINDFGKIK